MPKPDNCMPNRILRDYTDSLCFDGISADAERLFIRLITKADDYGRFHAEPRLLRAGCFPLENQIRPNDLDRWLDELSHRQLILRYEVEGRAFLAIINFGQRLKQSRPKFPPAPGNPDDWLPTSRNFPELPARDGDGDGDGDVGEDIAPAAHPPSLEKPKPPRENKPTKEGNSIIPKELQDIHGFIAEWSAFKEHRRRKRAPMTSHAEDLVLRKLSQRPQDAVAALQMAQERGWTGFEWSWVENAKQPQGPQQETAYALKTRLEMSSRALERLKADVRNYTYENGGKSLKPEAKQRAAALRKTIEACRRKLAGEEEV